jgi:hypothetical protein
MKLVAKNHTWRITELAGCFTENKKGKRYYVLERSPFYLFFSVLIVHGLLRSIIAYR